MDPTQPSNHSINPPAREARRKLMKNWRQPAPLLPVAALAASLLIAGVTYFYFAQRSPAPQKVIPSSSPTVSLLGNEGISLINQLPLWVPDIEWQEPELISGVAKIYRIGTGISSAYPVPPNIHEKIHEELTKEGWQYSGPADSPSGSAYTYTKVEQGKQRVVELFYQTKATVISGSGEPIRFAKCPCPYELTVVYSEPY